MIVHIHVPKTGGTSVRVATPHITHWGHKYAIREPSPYREYITTVRDPLARFASACGHLGISPEDADWDHLFFLPQINWLNGAERLRQPDVLWVGNTETLSQDWLRLTIGGDLPRLNAHDHGDFREWEPVLRERYAADYKMLEELWMAAPVFETASTTGAAS